MCKCISELQEKLVGMEWKKKKVIKAEFTSGALMFSNGAQYQATGEAEVMVEGGKKPIKVPIVYSYCPFCGKPYPKPK